MKVLIADKFESVGIEAIKELFCEVEFKPDVSGDSLKDALASTDPDILVVRSTKVPEDVQKAGSRLSLIIRAGAGYDTIDVESASNRGIFVANCPGKNSIAVAELTMGLLICCDRMIPDQTMELREGKWNKKLYSGKGRGLHGHTLGIIGFGRIAQQIAQRAKSFGMNIMAWSHSLTPDFAEELGVICVDSALDIARACDAISINVASNPGTKHLVDAEFLAAMKDGACLINTSRGALIDEPALIKAVEEKNLRVALDVYENEPGAGDKQFTNPIVNVPGIIGTHHIGASTTQAQLAIADETVRIIKAYVQDGDVPNCINIHACEHATHLLSVRIYHKPGALAHIFRILADDGVNVEEVEHIVYLGAEVTCARVHTDRKPSEEAIEKIKENKEIVITVDLSAIEN